MQKTKREIIVNQRDVNAFGTVVQILEIPFLILTYSLSNDFYLFHSLKQVFYRTIGAISRAW